MRDGAHTRCSTSRGSSPLGHPRGLPAWLLRLTFSSRSQAVPGPRGKTVDKHRRQDHGHHGQGAEAPPPLRAGRGADPHLHAHEEGRQGWPRVRREVLPSPGTRMREKGACGRGRKSSRPRVPGCGRRGRVWSWPEVLPSGSRMRGKGACVVVAGSPPVPGYPDAGEGACVVVALLLLGAELSAVSGLAPPCAPEPSGQGGAAAAAEALSGLLTLQLKGRPDRVTAPTSVRSGGSPSLHILSSGFCLQTFS